MSDPQRFFPGVHALRAAAATMVVAEHATYVASDYKATGITSFGVVLFFAISGFVISLQRTKTVGTFIRHRLLRIYPSYWLAMIIAATALFLIHGHVSASPSSILLYPSRVSDSSLTIPYWTLAFEMTFYALASVAFSTRLSDRNLTIIAILWIVVVNVIALAPTAGPYTFPGVPAILWSPAVQVFPMGLICGIHFESVKRFSRRIFFTGAIAAFCLSFPFAEYSSQKLLFLGLCASCLVLAVADFNIRSRAIVSLGDASYGIYLLHFPAIIVVASLSRLHGFIWLFAVGLMVGYLFGLVDHRLYRRLVGGRSREQLRPADLKARAVLPRG